MTELFYSEVQRIKEIAKCFNIKSGEIVYVTAINSGRINRTYKIVVDIGHDTFSYLLQRINTVAFKNPQVLMDNIIAITTHLSTKGVNTLKFVRNAIDGSYIFSNQTESGVEHWRMYEFIHSEVYNTITNPGDMTILGNVLGSFILGLSDFDSNRLVPAIPDFHNTRKRYIKLLQTTVKDRMSEDSRSRNERVDKWINFVETYQFLSEKILVLLESGKIPIRCTHNDPKLNNVLIDRKTRQGIAMIDLDTVMPGSVLYDIGDALRYGANTASEEEKDIKKVSFDLELFEAFIIGLAEELKDILTRTEIENISISVAVMAYELGIRFLSDYIDGNKYFKVDYDMQNLERAEVQFALVEDVLSKREKMDQIVKKYFKN